MSDEISQVYGNRLRVRVCGLLQEGDRLLLVKHTLQHQSVWWAPPGGGMEFGESIEQALRREFLEETNLEITVGQFAFGCEYIQDPLHAIELFFWVTRISGTLQAGQDPELPLIKNVRFMSFPDIAGLPRSEVHGMLHDVHRKVDLQHLKGFFRI